MAVARSYTITGLPRVVRVGIDAIPLADRFPRRCQEFVPGEANG